MHRPAHGAALVLVSSLTLLCGSLEAQHGKAEAVRAAPDRLASRATTPAQATPAASPPRSAAPLQLRRFRLLSSVSAEPEIQLGPVPESERLFHDAGDPDSLFTFFGSGGAHGELRLRAALELNDIVLRAMTPDPRLDPSDTRPRAGGDYRALDAAGRPYQLRLGARLVW